MKKNIVALGGTSLLIVAIVAMIVGASSRISEPGQVNASESELVISTTVTAVMDTFYSESDIFTAETIKNEPKMSENSEEPTETFQQMPCIEYTAEDLYWLQKCVQAEQGDFSYRASYLTGSCIVNRALTRNMTITEVIFEPGAFAVVSNG